ncbi:integrase core domain-containing protein [Micromonospora palythoicola]|uniref:integrase core domain-containing protein n=1 Tax=Micromonospora palythoicola TaxID=3120507 RepID=UPI002FCE15A1
MFTSLAEAQAAVDAYVLHYNTDRPHQALDPKTPVTPADRFQPVGAQQRALVDLWLPPTLDAVAGTPVQPVPADTEPVKVEPPTVQAGGPVEFDRVVPASGNLMVCQRQFWMGTHRAGMVARIWADCDLIHVLIAGIRIKTVRSHLSVNDLATLTPPGRRPGRPVASATDRGRRRRRG